MGSTKKYAWQIMDKINRSIVESLKNETYYKEARNWFVRKHISPIIDRSFLFLLLLAISISSVIYCIMVYSQFPLKISYMVPVSLSDTITYQPVLKDVYNLENETKPNRAMAKYLSANYVKIWESYSYDGLAEQSNKIMNNSTKNVYRNFYNYISLDNINSPVLLYQRSILRKTELNSVVLDENENKATIYFNAILTDKRQKILAKNPYIANIEFSMSDIENFIKNKQNKFYFIVTSYKSKQVN